MGNYLDKTGLTYFWGKLKSYIPIAVKAFESGLGAKSSLSDSDYIRVVGSDNNAYKQSVNSVISSWGIDKLTGQLASSFSGDANTLTSTGQWQVGNPANVQNLPSGVNYGIIAVESGRGYIYQRYVELATIAVYERRSVDGGANWNGWQKVPTRAEVDALNGRLSWNTTTSLPLSNCQQYGDIGVVYAVIGNMCHIYVSITGLTANSRVKIATLPSGARPMSSVQHVGGGGLSYTSKSYFSVGSDGAIFVVSDDNYASAYINFIVKP